MKKKQFFEIVKFEIFYKLLILGFVHPVLSGLLNLFVRYFLKADTLFNFDIFFQFLNIPGILFLFVYACLYLIFIYYEYIVFLKMIALMKKDIIFDFKDVAYSSLFELKQLKSWDSILAFIYFVILNPLWHLGYIQTFMPTFDIPPFITGEIVKMNYGSILIIGFYTLLFIIYGLLIYTPMYMVYKKESFITSMKFSCKKMIQDKKTWLVLIGLFGLSKLIHLQDLFYARTLSIFDFNFYFLRYFFFSSFFRSSIFQYLILSVIWFFIQYFFTSYLYSKEFETLPEWDIFPDGLIREKMYRMSDKIKVMRYKKTMILLLCVSSTVGVILYFSQFPLLHQPISIGHRGHIQYPENTIEGILAADSFDTDYAEIDIQMTKDHELVLMHDVNLKRLTGKDININEITLDELRSLNVSNKNHTCKIPTLEEAIIAAKESKNKIGLLIEFKPLENTEIETVDKTIELVEKYDFSDKAIFMSMNQTCVTRLNQKRPDWWTGYCAYGSLGNIRLRLDNDFFPDFLAIEESQINIQLLENARNNVLPVYVWTVDDPVKIEDYLRMGVSGIIGDASDQVADTVKEYKEQDDDFYLTLCPEYPKLTEDESEYVQCEATE